MIQETFFSFRNIKFQGFSNVRNILLKFKSLQDTGVKGGGLNK
ncbi:hypothetical protein KCTC52924_02023 [Arenibacter antarcticus]